MPDTPYSIVTISVLCLLFYIVSLVMARFGIISGAGLRKFWNTLLLVSLIVAGSLGIILAITVNLKINLPVTSLLLLWHVDFGIALFLVAIFHFLWHLKYYKNIFIVTENTTNPRDPSIFETTFGQPLFHLEFNLKRLPFSLGFTSMATQLILIREFLSVFNGNELTIGIVLANWMLLTALGALMNQKTTNPAGLKGIMTALFVLPVVPFISLFLLSWLRNIVLPVGSMAGIGQIMIGTAFLMAPFCILSGWLFSAISFYLSHSLKQNAVSLTYGMETLGSIAGGILCSMILVSLFEPFQNLAIVLLINSILLFVISRKEIFTARKKSHLYFLLAILVAAISFLINIDRISTQLLFPGQRIVLFRDTPYGKLVVTEKAGQLNFFDNNTLLFTTNNITVNEETAHYAMLQRKDTGNVLLVGGSISGAAQECLKYPLKRLDCVEINPKIHRYGKLFHRLPFDPRFRIYDGDARLFLKKSLSKKIMLLSEISRKQKEIDSLSYSAIILNLPEPSTLQFNRYYTLEFLKICKNMLTEKGIVTLSLMSTADYVGNDALKIQSTIYNTFKAVFKTVLVIQGEKNYFLASDGPLTPSVALLGTQQGIKNEYVNEYYLDDASLKERSDKIMERISVDAPLNLDFEPVACYRQIHYWLSYTGKTSTYVFIIALLFVMLFTGFRASGTTVAIFSAGLSSFSLEIILILTFQVIYGYVYLATGVFITLFMAGLAIGVFVARRFPSKSTYKSLVFMQIISGCIILLSIVVIMFFKYFQIHSILIYLLFGILVISVAVVTGIQFSIASVLKSGNIMQIAAANYSADLMGSAAGALLVNALIIPLYGLLTALLFIAGVIGVALVFMILKRYQ